MLLRMTISFRFLAHIYSSDICHVETTQVHLVISCSQSQARKGTGFVPDADLPSDDEEEEEKEEVGGAMLGRRSS